MTVVAVTGAAGFLGAHIIAALAAAGAEIRILAHRQNSHPLWRDLPVEIIPGSVLDAAACARLVEGADAVVHAAGLIKATREADFFEINAQGTATLARAARDADRPRFVLVSSLAARAPHLSPYAASKSAAEAAAQAVFAAAPERLVIIRPPPIYGPWDREALVLFKAAGQKLAPVFGTARIAVVYVEDAAFAIAQVAMGAAAAGRYALTGPDRAAYTLRQLLERAAVALGSNPRLIPVSGTLLRAAGRLSGWQGRLRGEARIFSAGKARELLHPDWTVAAEEALPFSVAQPAIRLDEGFRKTAAWYKSAGWL